VLLLLRQRSALVVKPLPWIYGVSVIRLSGLPVALAIAVLLDWVPISAHLLQLLLPKPDTRLLLLLLPLVPDARSLLLGLLPRETISEDFDPPLRLSLLL